MIFSWTNLDIESKLSAHQRQWAAEFGDLNRAGVIHIDPREIRGLEEEPANEEVRGIFELEVVQGLQTIINLDEVLEEQIPKIIRSIRDGAD